MGFPKGIASGYVNVMYAEKINAQQPALEPKSPGKPYFDGIDGACEGQRIRLVLKRSEPDLPKVRCDAELARIVDDETVQFTRVVPVEGAEPPAGFTDHEWAGHLREQHDGSWEVRSLSAIMNRNRVEELEPTIESLSLEDVDTGELNTLLMRTWPQLERLSLDLQFRAGHPLGEENLVESVAKFLRGHCPALKHLALHGGQHHGAIVTALVESPALSQLVSIDFDWPLLTKQARDTIVSRAEALARLELFPGASASREKLYDAAMIARDVGRHDRALELLEIEIASTGGDRYDWAAKGIALIRLGRHEEALPALDESIRQDPDDTVAPFNRVRALRELGRFDDALAEAEATLERTYVPKDKQWIRLWKVQVLEAAGRTRDMQSEAASAQKAIDDLSESHPHRAAMHYWTAAIYVITGALESALDHLAAAVAINPGEKADAESDELFAPLWGDRRFVAL